MLAIRLQRTGRKGHAQYRVIVQDSHRSPTSGRVVAYLGSYDPHTKVVTLKKEQAQTYLDNGAQPSDRVASLLKSEGVKLPKWVSLSTPIERKTRNPEKLRKNQSEQSEAPSASDESTSTALAAEQAPGATDTEASADSAPAEPEEAATVTEPTEDEASETEKPEEKVPAQEKSAEEKAE